MGEFERARQAFSKWAKSVPEWAFLRWVSQMLAVTGREEGPAVLEVGGCHGLVHVLRVGAWRRSDRRGAALLSLRDASPYFFVHIMSHVCVQRLVATEP